MKKILLFSLLLVLFASVYSVEAIVVPIRTLGNVSIMSWSTFDNNTNITDFKFNVTIKLEGNKYEFLNLGNNENKFQDMESLFIRNITIDQDPTINLYQQCITKLNELNNTQCIVDLSNCKAGKEACALGQQNVNNACTEKIDCQKNITYYEPIVLSLTQERDNYRSQYENLSISSNNNPSSGSAWNYLIAFVLGGGLIWLWKVRKTEQKTPGERESGERRFVDVDEQIEMHAKRQQAELKKMRD